MMSEDEKMQEKKLRGSGGFVIAHVSDEEQKKGNLGGPELFLAGVGRLPSERFVKYHCNKCDKDYDGAPSISSEHPNEDVGEGVILVEKGEYKCDICASTIAQYRKFDSTSTKEVSAPTNSQLPPENVIESTKSKEAPKVKGSSKNIKKASLSDGFVLMETLIGMPAYDGDAMLVGYIKEIGLRSSSRGKMDINLKVSKNQMSDNDEVAEIPWNTISKIGDIILLAQTTDEIQSKDSRESGATLRKCTSCGFENEADSIYCADCGKKVT